MKLLPVSCHSNQGIRHSFTFYMQFDSHTCLVSVLHEKSGLSDLVSIVTRTHFVTISFLCFQEN